jgi:ABC-type multidrug transport system ATPase subunit
MIVGLINPSRGTIQIGGMDISKEKNEAVKTLGLCPQFDVLYEDLTVEEHLLFYAR